MNMKREILYTLFAVLVFVVTGCEYDNFDAPTSMLTGTVNYQGTPVGVKTNGTQLELWQYGYQVRSKIAVYIAQDGTYSTRLFDGNYKMVRLSGAPWENLTDSIDVTVKGNTVIDVPVTPFFIISTPTFSYADSIVTASGLISKIGTRNIERVTLYIGLTGFVDAVNVATYYNKATDKIVPVQLDKTGAAISNLSSPLVFTLRLPKAIYTRKEVFARLAVKTTGVSEMYFSPVQKLTIY